MPVPRHLHSFTIEGTAYTGFAEPYSPKGDETPPEEGNTVKGWWRVLVDSLTGDCVQDAAVESIETTGGALLESGPCYVRQVRPYLSGLASDHVELLCVAYRGEA